MISEETPWQPDLCQESKEMNKQKGEGHLVGMDNWIEERCLEQKAKKRILKRSKGNSIRTKASPTVIFFVFCLKYNFEMKFVRFHLKLSVSPDGS